jgi:dienelactone hydrolase
MTRGHIIFTAAAGVIALHVLDDSFVEPQAGTSAADHLVSGLVPLAALALAVAAFPRLRGWQRGAMSLLLGLLGAVTGVEAVHYVREVGASGDDYTGLLAVPAGLTLMGLGAVTLWRTRSTTGHLARRSARRALLAVGAFLVFQFVAWPVGYGYVTTHVARPVVPAPHLGADFEEVSFTTSDDLELRGWYVPSRNGAAVIAFPGRKGPQPQARLLARHGYGVLLFDRRGEGESEGDPNAWGWGGHRDLDAAVRFLQSRPDVDPDRIGAIGRSVGGEMLLEAAADNDDIAAAVTEGAGARQASEAVSDLEGFEQMQGRLFYGLLYASVAVFSDQAPPRDLEELIPQIDQPLLLIAAEHGEVGDKTPEYLAAAHGNASAWIVPKGGHTGAIDAMPDEYERRVIGFLDRELAP